MPRTWLSSLGVVLIVIGVAGGALLEPAALGIRRQMGPAPVADDVAGRPAPWLGAEHFDDRLGNDSEVAGVASADEQERDALAVKQITGLSMPRIGIETAVVMAPFVSQGAEGTWEVPPFVAGHAELTAGAGQSGNAVLFGHVTSRTLGNVFQRLDRARVGDTIEVASAHESYIYEVTSVRRVPRTDSSVVDPSEARTISLVTCTGAWLPHLQDYQERLVVQGLLVQLSVNTSASTLLALNVD